MKVAVGLSGGVDSSVAAAILMEQGHEVTGIFMDTWKGDFAASEGRGCFGPRDEEVKRAKAVARELGMELHILDLAEAFQRLVLDYLRTEYRAGRTPNPCLRCNPAVKFGAMLDAARELGIQFERFATGHYAAVGKDPSTGRQTLGMATDRTKDQSYGLIFLTQEQLASIMLPLGSVTKREVREIAGKLGLASSETPDSQDFYAGDIADLVGAEPKPGPILDGDGNVLGEHQGVWHFTVGQRRGLGVPAGEPLYVRSIDAARNVITVGRKREIYSEGLVAGRVNYVSVESIENNTEAEFRIRHTQGTVPGTVSPLPGGLLEVRFEEPQWAVAPGQAVAVYREGKVLAGGIIEKVSRP